MYNFRSRSHSIVKTFQLRFVFYEKTLHIDIILVGKILTWGAAGVKKIFDSWFCQLIPVEMLFVMKKRSKIYIILVCKILIDGAMVVTLGKIAYLFTQYVHITLAWKSPTTFISQNIPAEMLFFYEKTVENSHYSGL